MRFVDQATISVSSGRGGAGAVSFRREKYVPRGGPDGGDGGRGGDVIVAASPKLQTLYDFTHRRHLKAENGRPGRGQQKTGRDGQDLVVEVPLGTLVYDDQTGQLLADLVRPGQRLVAARGGQGGRGNKHFATARNRAPRQAQPGQPGQDLTLRLELKLLADVALVGLPNAGKSTLISRASAARPKVADYPFTTLQPNLGVVEVEGFEPFVLADIPGLIKGASQGQGLGHRFLRHVERTRLLVFLLDATQDPASALAVLSRELEAFSPSLAARKRVLVLNKIDLLANGRDRVEEILGPGQPVWAVSALTGQGLARLMAGLAEMLQSLPDEEREDDRD
ncbi:MAG: GTPase ObgE [Deltaproteobacteria bacterium]|nr:GTPase ObgE [Deltaproteobacteria bacterium]